MCSAPLQTNAFEGCTKVVKEQKWMLTSLRDWITFAPAMGDKPEIRSPQFSVTEAELQAAAAAAAAAGAAAGAAGNVEATFSLRARLTKLDTEAVVEVDLMGSFKGVGGHGCNGGRGGKVLAQGEIGFSWYYGTNYVLAGQRQGSYLAELREQRWVNVASFRFKVAEMTFADASPPTVTAKFTVVAVGSGGEGDEHSGAEEVDDEQALDIDSDKIADDLSSLLDAWPSLSDFTVVCKKDSFPCHRAVLAARCDAFRAMLSHDTEEDQEDTLKITDLDPKAVGELIRYIYTGRVKFSPEVEECSLLAAADKYCLKGLKDACQARMCGLLSPNNVAAYLAAASLHGADRLKWRAVDMLADRWSDFSSDARLREVLDEDRDLYDAVVHRMSDKIRKG